MAKFILLVKGGNPDPSIREEAGKKWMAWKSKAQADGILLQGMPFEEKGKEVGKDSVTDLTSEFGGVLVINADSIDDAVELAQGMPSLEIGGKVSIHAVQEM